MAIHRWASRAFTVNKAGHTELGVTASPHGDLVVVHPDRRADVPVGAAVGSQQHQPSPLGDTCLDRAATHPGFQLVSITGPKCERR